MKRILLFILVCFLSQFSYADAPIGGKLGHDFTMQFVTGDLTATGTQYTDYDSTTTTNTDVTFLSKTFDLSFGDKGIWPTTLAVRTIFDVYFEITVEVQAKSTATADIIWKAQARNKDGTWTDLFAEVLVSNPNTSWTASTRKGYATPSGTFDEVPFDVRLIFQCNESNEGRARVKSGSYSRVMFKNME